MGILVYFNSSTAVSTIKRGKRETGNTTFKEKDRWVELGGSYRLECDERYI